MGHVKSGFAPTPNYCSIILLRYYKFNLRGFYLFISFKFHTLLKTGYHDQNTADIKDVFDLIDEDTNGFISFVEWTNFATSNAALNIINLDNRQAIQDRLSNALLSSHFETAGTYLSMSIMSDASTPSNGGK